MTNAKVPAAGKTTEMRCYICDAKDWTNLGQVVEKEIQDYQSWPSLGVCNTCGNLAYLVDVSQEKSLLDFYRKNYRSNPTESNLISTTTKQNYIMRALKPVLDSAKKANKQLVCGDVGCATGYIPAHLRSLGHKATGSEYTPGFRRFAEHYYGVLVTEELEEKHTYDLITCYHVLEHMMEPDKKLAKMRDLLDDDGYILIATPEWLTDLEVQSGEGLKGRWHYFHKNHINCFTVQSLKNLFAKVGLEIVTEDHVVYGQTYLLRKSRGGAKAPIIAEKPQDVVKKVHTYLEAIDLFKAGKFEEALDIVPSFPEALINLAFVRHAKDPETQADILKRGEKTMPSNWRVRISLGEWLFQQQQYPAAKAVLIECFNQKPNVQPLFKLGWCHYHLGEFAQARDAWNECARLNPTIWTEATRLAVQATCQLPHWEEVATAKAMESLKGQIPPAQKPKDKGIDSGATPKVAPSSKNEELKKEKAGKV